MTTIYYSYTIILFNTTVLKDRYYCSILQVRKLTLRLQLAHDSKAIKGWG